MKAIRFLGAGFDAAVTGGLGLTSAGTLAMTDGDESVRQALFLLLSTTPGERLMRPGYGSRLHRLLFAPNDDTTAGLAIHYVRQAIARWEPRVDVIDVDAHPDPDAPWRLLIRLDYRVKASLSPGVLAFSVDLDPYAQPGSEDAGDLR
ncbi:GPW/gp25 family protein [Hamadaea sp. NPDC050747]|uniref:GPW/gp25 family protein n=1 Tax=Hamadaea sp. NPDC050747 TaxID=3155789 RepID=UPI0033DB4644